MTIEYDFASLEKQVQAHWEKTGAFLAKQDTAAEKFYCLAMLPYPSGHLHMGHVRNYTLSDTIAHYQRMQGKNVLHPLGWDAFGLPAENAAIQRGVAPAEWTEQNIDCMRKEFKALGLSFDWSREFTTCTPDYYRWEQWFFIQLFKKGLAYQKETAVNWDPVDQTVLANEQVKDGRGWRSGATVEQRNIKQWFIRTTAYAEELLQGLDTLTQWPESVVTMQRHWIGKSEGLTVDFRVQGKEGAPPLSVYTTRADTLMGIAYLAVAPEHPLAQSCAEENPLLADFCATCHNIKVAEADAMRQEKVGIDTGKKAIHPITGALLPIWVANYVLMTYGSGVVMAVPAHDTRDFAFAHQYGLAYDTVIVPEDGSAWDTQKQPFTEPGRLIHSGDFDGKTSEQARKAIAAHLIRHQQGRPSTQYRLRDWGVSRQRYWGTPIPMIHCKSCGPVPVPEDQLPVILPESVKLTGKGDSPLASVPEFYHTHCPDCGEAAQRETDTFDTFINSAWYYARYACPNASHSMLDDRARYWTPVDQYVGGIEHATMHLLYARLMHKLLRDQGLMDSDEPFISLLTQGMVLKDGSKMSKSKGNVVTPAALLAQYGADTLRLFSIFAGPPEQSIEWSDSGVEGCHRFLKRLWSFAHRAQPHITSYHERADSLDWKKTEQATRDVRKTIHTILAQADFDMQRLQCNTVVSAAMKLFNVLAKIAETMDAADALLYEGISILLRLLAPVTPHICHHLWNTLGYGTAVLRAPWPSVDPTALTSTTIRMVVQINGKLRSEMESPIDATELAVQKQALAEPKIQAIIENRPLRKCIVIPNKLVNLVVDLDKPAP